MRTLLVALAACCCAHHAAAVNKCLNAEGDKVTYSDAPCREEGQPVNATENTIVRDPNDRRREQEGARQSQQQAQDLQRQHRSQYEHALRIRAAAEAEERERERRNQGVQPIVPRTQTTINPVAPGMTTPPNWYPR